VLVGKHYCSHLCSCGALAETVGNSFRHRGPKADWARWLERFGFAFIGLASVVTISALLGFNLPLRLYNVWVGTLLAGALAIGLYPFLGQRIWCRYWCPLAFWMNFWGRWSRFKISPEPGKCIDCNVFVISGVINHNVQGSVMDYKSADGTGFFDRKEHIFAGDTVSLNHIEHVLIRPVFGDPRIHMALVCAARSCPVIRREAYSGASIDKQLEDQATLFANNPQHVTYDSAAKSLSLSALLKWYGDDFDTKGGYLSFLVKRVQDESIAAGMRGALDGTVNVAFKEYDWALNSQEPKASAGKGSKRTDFGSGSIPNE